MPISADSFCRTIRGAAEEFVIPAGTVIPAGGFLVYEQVSPGQGESFTFGLSSKGDKVVLLDSERKVADEVDTPDFGDTKGESYARTVDGGGEWRIAAVPTKGFSNTGGADASLKGGACHQRGLHVCRWQ